jgi:hydrophobic/amphiphilic exporter-1 (mainly G- bacteria), HAE1 family
LTLPEGITYEIGGQSKEMQASLQSLWMAMLLAIFLVYVIMASSFESIVHPFVILFSVPLALVGVSLTLWVLDIDISAVVAIGAIVLAGVVVNNAIVLVDTINRLRTEGLSRDDAILRAGALRLRPILMTTTTTVLGLVPLAVAPLLVGVLPDALTMAEGIEIQQPLAVTLIGGLLSSTLLTLVIVPVLYRLMTRVTPSHPAQT